MSHFLLFGTHPRLSLAEFQAVSPQHSRPRLIGPGAIVEETSSSDAWDGAKLMDQLGGTVKLGNIIFQSSVADFSVEQFTEQLLSERQWKRLEFGWTVYGGTKSVNQTLSKRAIEFKKALKQRDISSRWVTGKNGEPIAPAAVAKLNLTTEGLDLCLFVDGETLYVGQTTHVQNADAWSERDYGRPARDEKTGMMPPKLSRMMVNLARVPSGGVLWDPFCGGGTTIMEAELATSASRLIGSDIDATQIANAKQNFSWLLSTGIVPASDRERVTFFQLDARRIGEQARELKLATQSVDAIVAEGYLGPPLTGHETLETLQRNVKEISKLWIESLTALRPLLKKNARLVVIWPAFKTSHGVARVELDQDVERIGYRVVNPLEGWDETNGPLLYSRPEQKVMRRIVVLRIT